MPPPPRSPAPRSSPNTPHLVDPAAEVRRDARRRARRSRSARATPSTRERSSRIAPERLLRRRPRAGSRVESARDGISHAPAARRSAARAAPAAAAQSVPSGVVRIEARPTRSRASARARRAAASICSPVSSAEWFSGRPAIGRPEALDRVGEDDARAVVSARAPRRAPSIMSPRSCPPRSWISGATSPSVVVQQRGRAAAARPATASREQRLATTSSLGAEEALVELVRHLVDAPAQQLAAVAANASRRRRPYFSSSTCQPRRRTRRSSSCGLDDRARRGRGSGG